MIRVACLLSVMFVSVVHAYDSVIIAPLVVEGDSVDGVGLVDAIDNLAINDFGEWLVEANTDFANLDEDTVLLKNGNVFLREGFGGLSGPPGALIGSFDSVSLSNTGSGGFNFFLDPLPFGEDSGVYLNTSLIVQESCISTAPEFTPGTPFIGFFDVKINNLDNLMIVASIDDPAINSTVDRAVMIVDTMTGEQSVVAKEGDTLPGQVGMVEDFGTGPHESAVNDNDSVLYVAQLTGNPSTDNAIYLNQTLLAQEGFSSPLAGRTYEFLAGRGIDVNNLEEFVFKANLSGDTADDDVIIKNGSLFKQEGDPAPGGFAFTGFGTNSGPVFIADNGAVLWFGEWNDPNGDINSGLFLDDTLLVREGVTKIDGLVVDTISSGTDAFSMSDNGTWIVFEATLVGGINGAFSYEVGATRLGDVNLDGSVDLLDVQPFVNLIGSGDFQVEADTNCDGSVDLLDVTPFIAILTE